MNFTTGELNGIIEAFTNIEKEIKGVIATNAKDKIQQKEIEIVNAYNEIIRYAYPIWQSTDKRLKENVKTTLVDIYYRLKNNLHLLGSDIELPTYLTILFHKLEKDNQRPGTSRIEETQSTVNNLKGTRATLQSEQNEKNYNKKEMGELNELRAQLQEMQLALQASMERQQNYEQQFANLNRNNPIQATVRHEDITTVITSGDQIQLESYRSIPEFSGIKNQYRSWRNQVTRRMGMISNFKTHPKYEAALGIIRSKITGPAADVLTNNKTAYNIDAIIERLDSSYTDQRPLYIVEAEMLSITQSNKTLQEFYDSINQALNMVISKIVMSYKQLNEQEPLIAEAQKKAIRTFIVGVKSYAIRNILYSHKPRTLAEAFATAQTVHYDNEYLHLDPNRGTQKNQPRPQRQQGSFGKINNGIQSTQNFRSGPNVNVNCKRCNHKINRNK